VPLFLAIWLLPILLAVLYDWRRRRRVHPVYLIGLGALVMRILVAPVSGTAKWAAIASEAPPQTREHAGNVGRDLHPNAQACALGAPGPELWTRQRAPPR
jgi:hypothetical protein